jgi:hypothetical protein
MSEYVHPSEIPEDIRQEFEQKRRQKLGQGSVSQTVDPSEIPPEVLEMLKAQRRQHLIQQLKR